MKNTILLLAFFFCHAVGIYAQQVTVQDDAKVGLIVTGTGNTINTTQIFGKSPEYAELKSRLSRLEASVRKQVEECEQMRRDNLPAKYLDGCRTELIILNAERDSMQKLETKFREDVINLAERFSKMELNSERLQMAKKLFDEGRIREADHILNAHAIKQEGDALLAERTREQDKLRRIDSLLLIKSEEFALKAQLKVTDYSDSLRFDSAELYFVQSMLYGKSMENLWTFGRLLYTNKQTNRGIKYLEEALSLANNEIDKAALNQHLGAFYSVVNRLPESEKMYLNALEIFGRLAESNPTLFEPNQAKTIGGLGNLYIKTQKIQEGEKMYLRALEIQERLVQNNPVQFEPDLAWTLNALGRFYKKINKIADAEKMYLRALEIRERLVQNNPAQFEPDLAWTLNALGNFYVEINKIPDAEKMYLRALEIRERLVQNNPAQFEPDLAWTLNALGKLYVKINKLSDAEKMYLETLEIRERLVQNNPAQFEPDLAETLNVLGNFYVKINKLSDAEKMYLRALEIRERLVQNSPAQFEPDLAWTLDALGNFYVKINKVTDAEKMYLRALEIRERLVQNSPAQFEPGLAETLSNLCFFYLTAEKNIQHAEKICLAALEIRERIVQNNATQFESDFARSITDLGIYYAESNRMDEAEKMFLQAKKIRERLAEENPVVYKLDLALIYGNLSAFYLLTHEYSKSAEAAEKSLVIDPSQNWIRVNLGHAHLLRGKWDKAKTIYRQYIVGERDPVQAKATLLKDWGDLEKLGAIPKERMSDLEKARAWAKE